MSHRQQLMLCSLLFILLSVNVSSLPSKVAGIDIDKFLKKVILSEKFDEIVDKIAEKAANKITNMKNIEIKAIDNAANQKELTYRVSENEYEKNVTQSKSDAITPHKPIINEEVIKYTMREIDIGNKKKLKPTDGLVLKFKHFTKHDKNSSDTFVEQNRKGKTLKNISFLQRSEQDKLKGKPKQLQQEPIQTTKLQSNEILDNASDANKDNSSEYVLMSYENINESAGIPAAIEEEVVKTESANFKSRADDNESSVSNSNEKDSLNLEFEENYKAFMKYKKQQNEKKTIKSKPIDIQDSPSLEEVETTVNESHSSEEEKRTTIKVVNKSSETQEIQIDDTTQTLVRQEGDKLYTYEKSPDYKEYHEKLALLKKKM